MGGVVDKISNPDEVEYVWVSGNTGKIAQCVLGVACFGVLAVLYVVKTFHMIFLRQKKPSKKEELTKPVRDASILHWLRYAQYVTRPGAEYFWHRTLFIEISEFILQGIRLAKYG